MSIIPKARLEAEMPRFEVTIKDDEAGAKTVYTAADMTRPGCMAQGKDPVDALKQLYNAQEDYDTAARAAARNKEATTP